MAQAHLIPRAIPAALIYRGEAIGFFGSGQKTVALARMAARHGFGIRIADPRPGAAHAAAQAVAKSLDGLAPRGGPDSAAPGLVRPRITASESPRDLRGAALVIEASGGDLETKRRALSDLECTIDSDAILATETAMSSVSALARGTARPERIVGLHLVQSESGDLVEIVRALQTSDAAHDAACRIVRAFGKKVVATDDRAGFLVFRLLVPVINEACFALQEGLATVEDIDCAARLGSDSPGPLRMADTLGLDRCLQAAEHLQRELGDAKYRPAPLLRNYVAARWLGKKTLRGFYSYSA